MPTNQYDPRDVDYWTSMLISSLPDIVSVLLDIISLICEICL